MTHFPRILLAGSYGQGNLGDEAIADALVAGLRDRLPDARLTVVAGDEEAVRTRLQVETVPWSEWALIGEAMLAADLVVVGGGGLFFDWSGFDPQRVLEDAFPDLAHYVGLPLLASALGRPLALAAVGVGPLQSPHGRSAVAAVAGLTPHITVRDQASASLLAELGAGPIEITTDPAFGLRPCPPRRVDEILDAARQNAQASGLVGVVLRPWPHVEGWEPRVAAALTDFLRTTDARALLVPFHCGTDEAPLERLCARLPAGRSQVLPAGHTGAEIAGVLGRCELVVAMRLHGVILAAIGGTPAVGLAYAPKVFSALDGLGHPELAVPMGELERLPAVLARAWARRSELRPSVASAAAALAPVTARTIDRVLDALAAPVAPVDGRRLLPLLTPAVIGLLKRARVAGWACERVRREGEARLAADHAALAGQVDDRDHIIRGLQAELFSKVSERDRIIRELQEEMFQKVEERDRMIRELQAGPARCDATAPTAPPPSNPEDGA